MKLTPNNIQAGMIVRVGKKTKMHRFFGPDRLGVIEQELRMRPLVRPRAPAFSHKAVRIALSNLTLVQRPQVELDWTFKPGTELVEVLLSGMPVCAFLELVAAAGTPGARYNTVISDDTWNRALNRCGNEILGYCRSAGLVRPRKQEIEWALAVGVDGRPVWSGMATELKVLKKGSVVARITADGVVNEEDKQGKEG